MDWRHSQLRILLNNAYYFFITPLRRVVWYVTLPHKKGAKCVPVYDGKLFLTRPTYAHKSWTFPGGSVKRGESFEAGALRELWEEARMQGKNPQYIGTYESTRNHRTDTVQVFVVDVEDPAFDLDPSEIAEGRWFVPEEIPKDVPSVGQILAMYNAHQHDRHL